MKLHLLQAQCRTWETFYSVRECEGGACSSADRTGFVSNISYFGAMAGRRGVDGGVLWVLWNGKILHTSIFLTLTLDEGEFSASHPGRSIHGYRPSLSVE